ncbi:hypothetical protein JTB14_033725 [Gonioctena quinquepunctata]|nr:hypothetical protein JTB14_033725 [Gonioctena quinquepunctata]
MLLATRGTKPFDYYKQTHAQPFGPRSTRKLKRLGTHVTIIDTVSSDSDLSIQKLLRSTVQFYKIGQTVQFFSYTHVDSSLQFELYRPIVTIFRNVCSISIEDVNLNRIQSRRPPTRTARVAVEDEFNLANAWTQE